MLVGRDTGSGDDGLDDRLAIGALSSTVSGEGLLRLFEGEAVGDEWLEVDLALGNETNGEFVITGLEESHLRIRIEVKKSRRLTQ